MIQLRSFLPASVCYTNRFRLFVSFNTGVVPTALPIQSECAVELRAGCHLSSLILNLFPTMSTSRHCLTAALKSTTRRLPFQQNHLSTTAVAAAISSPTSTAVLANCAANFQSTGPLHLSATPTSNSCSVANVGGAACRGLMTLSSASSSLSLKYHPDTSNYDTYQKRQLFDKRKRKKKKKRRRVHCPFKVLGVKENMLYKDVKKKFLIIAMENHPDTAAHKAATEEELETMREKFITARTAFESLVECSQEGVALHKSDVDDEMDNFDSWFKSETGFDTPFQFDMDPETMKVCAYGWLKCCSTLARPIFKKANRIASVLLLYITVGGCKND